MDFNEWCGSLANLAALVDGRKAQHRERGAAAAAAAAAREAAREAGGDEEAMLGPDGKPPRLRLAKERR